MGVQDFILSYYKKNNKMPDSLLLKGIFMVDIESDEMKESIKYAATMVKNDKLLIDFISSYHNSFDIEDRILARLKYRRYVLKIELYDGFYGKRDDSLNVINRLLNRTIAYDISTGIGRNCDKEVIDIGDRYILNPYYLDEAISSDIDNE